jgi:predicted RNA binding protein YcfA (HicA-like mRNA interferase family)
MKQFGSAKARRVLSALERKGWAVKRQTGSHKTLEKQGKPDFIFAFHDADEIGPRMLARIAKATGMEPDDI